MHQGLKSQPSSVLSISLTLSWRRPLSYRNQSIVLQSKSMDWFLYDNGLRHERVKIQERVKLAKCEKSISCRFGKPKNIFYFRVSFLEIFYTAVCNFIENKLRHSSFHSKFQYCNNHTLKNGWVATLIKFIELQNVVGIVIFVQ